MAFLSGCAATIQVTKVYKESPVEVYRVQTIGKDGSPVDAGYQHPLELSAGEVFKLIRSVQVRIEPGKIQRLISKTKTETGPAFSIDDAAALAPGLSLALAAATPADRVHFQINHPDAFSGGTLSTGVLFVKGDRIQLILQSLRYAPGAGDYDTKSRFRQPEKVVTSQDLVILPGPHQGLFPTDSKKLQSRWVSIDYRALLSSLPEPEFEISPGEAVNDADFEKRLERLKSWRERGLITEEVYRRKQEEILKGF